MTLWRGEVSAKIDVERLRALWASDKDNGQVARELGIPSYFLHKAAARLRLPRRPAHLRAPVMQKDNSPTAAEIEARSAEVRAGWTKSEERRRRVGWGQDGVFIQNYRTSESRYGTLQTHAAAREF